MISIGYEKPSFYTIVGCPHVYFYSRASIKRSTALLSAF